MTGRAEALPGLDWLAGCARLLSQSGERCDGVLVSCGSWSAGQIAVIQSRYVECTLPVTPGQREPSLARDPNACRGIAPALPRNGQGADGTRGGKSLGVQRAATGKTGNAVPVILCCQLSVLRVMLCCE
jgi:hypothetical protein